MHDSGYNDVARDGILVDATEDLLVVQIRDLGTFPRDLPEFARSREVSPEAALTGRRFRQSAS